MDWGRGADGWGVYVFGVSSLPKLGFGGGLRDLRYMLRFSFFCRCECIIPIHTLTKDDR